MTRLDIVNKYIDKQEELKRGEEEKKREEIESLKNQIKKYTPHIKELCELIEALDKANLIQDRGQEGKKYVADSFTHKLGYLKMNGIRGIGKFGGGCCRYKLALLENGELIAEGDFYDLKNAFYKFLQEFDNLKNSVYGVIDDLEIQMKIEDEKGKLIEYLKNDEEFIKCFKESKKALRVDYISYITHWLDNLYCDEAIILCYLDVKYKDISYIVINDKIINLDYLYEDFKDYLGSQESEKI